MILRDATSVVIWSGGVISYNYSVKRGKDNEMSI